MLQGLGSWRPRATASQAGGFGPQTLKGFDQILAAKASQDWAEAEKFLLTPPPRDEAQGGGGLLGVWGRGETVSSTPAPPPCSVQPPFPAATPLPGSSRGCCVPSACLAPEQAFLRAAGPCVLRCRLLTPRSPSPHPLPHVRALSFTFRPECPVY